MNTKSARRHFLLVVVFLAQLHFLGCKEDIVQIPPGDAPPVFMDDPNGVVGRWYWTESNGGMGGRWTPEKAGYTRIFWFKPDSTFAVYTNDTLRGEGHFRVYWGLMPFASSYPVQIVEFYSKISGWMLEAKFEIQFPCQDTIVLYPRVADVGYSVYGRLKPTPSITQAKRLLHGSWKWIRSYNPFDGTTSPETAGYKETWVFGGRGVFLRFRSDTLFRSGTYRIFRESFPPAVKDTLLVVLIRQEGEYDLYGKVKMCGANALTVDESFFCFNCGYYRFEKQQ